MNDKLVEIRTGTDVFTTFEKLKQDSLFAHGRYDGTFATCRLKGVRRRFDGMFKKRNQKDAEQHIANAVVEEGDAYAVDMGIDHYEIITVDVVPSQNTKIAYRYLVETRCNGKQLGVFASRTEAKDFVKRYAEVTCENVYIKERYCVGGDEYEGFRTDIGVKVRKSKPAIVHEGSAVREVHKYYFYAKPVK